MKIHDCEQGTLEWTKLHFGIPTASGLDNLITPEFELRKGETPKTYIYKKVAEKLQGRPLIDLSASSLHETSDPKDYAERRTHEVSDSANDPRTERSIRKCFREVDINC